MFTTTAEVLTDAATGTPATAELPTAMAAAPTTASALRARLVTAPFFMSTGPLITYYPVT